MCPSPDGSLPDGALPDGSFHDGALSSGAVRAGSFPGGSFPGGAPLSAVSTGRWAESLAACYLSLCGFRVLARNYRDGPRELDLLAAQGTWAVVVEVRFRSSNDRGRPEETVHHRKRTQLLRAGRAWWLGEGRRFGALRFDLVTIELLPRGMRLRHFPHFMNPERPQGPGVW